MGEHSHVHSAARILAAPPFNNIASAITWDGQLPNHCNAQPRDASDVRNPCSSALATYAPRIFHCRRRRRVRKPNHREGNIPERLFSLLRGR